MILVAAIGHANLLQLFEYLQTMVKFRFADVQVILFIMLAVVSLSFIFINSLVLISDGDLTDGDRSSKYDDVPVCMYKVY